MLAIEKVCEPGSTLDSSQFNFYSQPVADIPTVADTFISVIVLGYVIN